MKKQHGSKYKNIALGLAFIAITMLSLVAAAAPVNDDFANATVLPASWTSANGHNTNATAEAGELHHSSDPGIANGGRSVWWKWTPNFSGQVKITTKDSGGSLGVDPLDTQLAVYKGASLAGLTLVARNEDHVDFMYGWSRVDFAAVAGTTYYIVVDSYEGHFGQIKLNFTLTGAAPKFALTVNVSPLGTGSVTLDPPQPDGGYDSGTVVTLSATGESFSAWGGAASGSVSPVSITMNGPKNVTAMFGSDHQIMLQNPNTRQLAAWLLDGTNFLGGSLVRNGLAPTAAWQFVGMADFNNDESSDLLFRHDDGRLAVWFMNGTSFTGSSLLNGGQPVQGWRVVGIGDFDTNGSPDVLFQHNNTAALAVWLMNGTALQSSVLIRSGASTGVWRAVGAADINGNTRTDIVFQHPDGRMAVWYMNGTAFVSSALVRNGATVAASWRLVGFANLDGAGTVDFLWQNSNGQLAVWLMNNTTLISSKLLRNGASAGVWQAKGVD